jgi:hypothetical protein
MLTAIVLSIFSISNIGGQVELYGQYTLPNNDSVWLIRRNIVSAQRYMARAFSETDAQDIDTMFALAQQDGKEAVEELEKYAGNQRNTDRDAKSTS